MLMVKQVLSIDPGGTTGIAIRVRNRQLLTSTCSNMSELREMLEQEGLEHVVIETFQAETISKYGLLTVRLIGGVQMLCEHLKLPLTEHMPYERKPFLKDARKVLEGRKVVIHEIDATAHLLRFEYDNKLKVL